MNHFAILIQLLRNRKQVLVDIQKQIKLDSKIASLILSSSCCFACYGAIMGAYSGSLQIASSTVKLPALYLLTLLICLPTLFIFDTLFGSSLSFPQYVAMGLTAAGTTSLLLVSFAPVMLFFLLSIRDYNFFLLLNVLVMAFTGAIGIRLFYNDMCDVVGPKVSCRLPRRYLLMSWIVLYGLIGSQLGWTLSPFVGMPEVHFQAFRSGVDSNFYAEVLRILEAVIGP